MKPPHDPESMTPDQRRREVAAILAQGVLRYRRRVKTGLSAAISESSSESQNCLELSGESRLHLGGAAG